MAPLIVSGLFSVAENLISRFFPDPAKAAEAKLDLLKMQASGELARLAAATDLAKLQVSTNIEEAKSTNWFVSGWRPFVGWVCGSAFAYNYIFLPFLLFFVYTFGTYEMVTQVTALPKIDIASMMPILLGMLGLGYLRTDEKKVGVSRS